MPETIDLDFGKFMESFSATAAASPAVPAKASITNRPAPAPAKQ
jgi:hypothetical protein